MPRTSNSDNVPADNPALESALAKSGAGIATTKEKQPMYRVMPGSRIPVSKSSGPLWRARRDQGLSSRKSVETCWNEAIRYYENDQTFNRTARENSAGNAGLAQRLNSQWSETENIVFANCAIMVPMLYAKNPTISCSTENDAHVDLAKAIQKLGNKLMSMKSAPGLNFKVKARRMILTALLTNNSIIKIGWTSKQDSDVAALEELERLSKKLESAKTRKEIIEVEGEIMALEEKVALLSPSGPMCRNLTPDRIVRDPTAMTPDFTEDNWVMEWDMLPTSYINAVYTTKQDDVYRSVYEPTHVLNKSVGAVGDGDNVDGHLDDVVNNFTLIKDQSEATAASFGYDSKEAYKAACYTKVWYVWDKVTRRVYMYSDADWKWPIWVWDDPLKLPRFYPYFNLWFHESTNSNAPKGEVTYYLDQQDAINEIADEERRARGWAKRNILYKKGAITQDDVEKVLLGNDGTARGIEIPEGQKIEDLVFSFVPPSMKFPELFNKDSKFAAVNRITGVNDAMRGGQFKTNTTNKAIDAYQMGVEFRTDERVDLVEDCISDVMWNISMLCLMNWEVEDVQPLIGQACAQYWVRIQDPRMFDTMFNVRVEGGSIDKPNSRAKKQQAVELGQVLGQFANAAPATIIVMLKMFERAFDEFIITDEEWQLIEQTMMASLQKAGTGPGGEAQPGAEGEAGAAEQEIRARIEGLPPEAQQQLQAMVQQGMSPSDALAQVEAAANQTRQ